jgi:hypothetical protein
MIINIFSGLLGLLPVSSLIERAVGQISAHAKGCLDTLIVAGKLKQYAVTHSTIKELRFFIPGSDLEIDIEYARYPGAFFQPLNQLAPDTASPIRWSDSKQVQVCVVVAVAHDRKAGNLFVHRCNQYVDVGCANTRCDPYRRPAPIKTVFDQIARKMGNAVSLRQARQTQR